ncbi:hypothetical protein BDW74DRAFT_8496 [Aspergillus multicolor]|uniref:uncharacterized protein n=1 Tax=Aspergillus multicolor TaxID=41759 RepID=UPI003CCD7816
MPFYLWDVQERCCCITKDLKETVQYTTISHTWGRWKRSDVPPVLIEGVKEWLIPQNTRFNVTDLPSILESAGARLKTRFIGFDLLCIPQDPDSDGLKQIARREIARQAKIFRGAEHAVAWLNDVDGWSGLNFVLRYLSIRYVSESNNLPSRMLELVKDDEGEEIELIESDLEYEEDGLPSIHPNGWLSSLWTLQELCLRPDMFFCDRSWQPFSVDGSLETAVRLDDFIALQSISHKVHAREQMKRDSGTSAEPNQASDDNPIQVDLFGWVTQSSALFELPSLAREAILSMGNMRYCEA